MVQKIYIRRGTKAELDSIVLEAGEPGWATDTKEFYMGDGTTSGGIFIGTSVELLSFTIDGGGSTISTGEKGHLEVIFACTIKQLTMLADQSGSVVVDIWKDTYANFPPTDADSITASAIPTISSDIKSQDLALNGWTTTVAAGDVLAYNVDSCSGITRVTLGLKVEKG